MVATRLCVHSQLLSGPCLVCITWWPSPELAWVCQPWSMSAVLHVCNAMSARLPAACGPRCQASRHMPLHACIYSVVVPVAVEKARWQRMHTVRQANSAADQAACWHLWLGASRHSSSLLTEHTHVASSLHCQAPCPSRPLSTGSLPQHTQQAATRLQHMRPYSHTCCCSQVREMMVVPNQRAVITTMSGAQFEVSDAGLAALESNNGTSGRRKLQLAYCNRYTGTCWYSGWGGGYGYSCPIGGDGYC